MSSDHQAQAPAASCGRVLIIEDDDDMRMVQTTWLQTEGWDVAGARTGAEGVATAVARPPEVIICDRRLPDIDGLDVVRALTEDEATAQIPVVVVTALVDVADLVQALGAGAHELPHQAVQVAGAGGALPCCAAGQPSAPVARAVRGRAALRWSLGDHVVVTRGVASPGRPTGTA